MKKSVFLLGALALLAGCQQEESYQEESPYGFDVTLESIVPNLGLETRTYADDQHLVLWHNDDRVSVFEKKEYWEEYKYTGRTGTTGGRLTKVPGEGSGTGGDLDYYYAVYPHSELNGFDNQGHLLLTLPHEQPYDEFSFGRGTNLMVSSSEDNTFKFKNIGGYLVFKLYGEGVSVSSIRLTGNCEEEISGDIDVVVSPEVDPIVKMSTARYAEKYNYVDLVCDPPVALGATSSDYKEFWFVLPPMTFLSGFSIKVTTTDGIEWTKTTNKAWAITRNHYTPVSVMEVVLESSVPEEPEENIVFADESIKTALVDAFDTNDDGELSFSEAAAVTSLEGVFGTTNNFTSFDEFQYFTSITSIPSGLFAYWKNLTSISLPESISNISIGAFSGCSSLRHFNSSLASEDNRCLIINGVLIAFAQSGVTSYTIPSSVSIIGDDSFQGCSQIRSLIVPSSVNAIGKDAFKGMSSLIKIVFQSADTPTGVSEMFKNTNNCPIFVPENSLKLYKKAMYWKDYSDRIVCAVPEPNAIDVGLSVKWGSFNIGASAPEEAGYFYSWGEISTKDNYSWTTYRYCSGSSSSLTKYGVETSGLDETDDVVRVLLGGKWRMPTWKEYYALACKLNFRWEDNYNSSGTSGIVGYINSPSSGRIDYLFFPAGGNYVNTNLSNEGEYGAYWISNRKDFHPSTLDDVTVHSADKAFALVFNDYTVGNFNKNGSSAILLNEPRYLGLNIRPVWDPNL